MNTQVLTGLVPALMEKVFGPSWKTSASGVMGGVGLVVSGVISAIPAYKAGNVENLTGAVMMIAAGVSMAWMGLKARDKSVTSEQERAAK